MEYVGTWLRDAPSIIDNLLDDFRFKIILTLLLFALTLLIFRPLPRPRLKINWNASSRRNPEVQPSIPNLVHHTRKTGYRQTYNSVHVLLISWEGADSRFENQLNELKNVFKDYYHYDGGNSDVKAFLIPEHNAKNALEDEITTFIRKDGPGRLLILYYGGHGAMTDVDRRAIWKKYERSGPEVPWHDMQSRFFERQADVLMLIDCCAASSATIPPGASGTVEVIFASGFEGTTPIWGSHSFTVNIINELKRVHDVGILVVDLSMRLSNVLRQHRPIQLGREQRADPHHYFLAHSEPPRFIHLRSLISETQFQTSLSAPPSPEVNLNRADSLDVTRFEKERTAILKWLDPNGTADQSRFHNAAVAAKEGLPTGQWLLKHDGFLKWLKGQATFLIIYGLVGCGKTVLCASIVNFLEELYNRREWPKSRNLVAKFYFSFEESTQKQTKRDLDSLLRSIIQQLSLAPEIFSELRALYDDFGRTWPPSSPPTSEIQKRLLNGLRSRCSDASNPRHVFLVIDALDEIPKGPHRDEIMGFLKDLAGSGIPYLHAIASSRPKSDIRQLSETPNLWTQLVIDRLAVQADIIIYVNSVLQTDSQLSELPELVKDDVRQRLGGDKDGMFRWAKLQVESLKRLDPATVETVEDALEHLPADLNATYLKILDDISLLFRQRAANALKWLCLASRAIFIEELIEIFAMIPGEEPEFQESRRLSQRNAVDILRDLIAVEPPLDRSSPIPQRNVVTLAHFSVKEYLTGKAVGATTPELYRVDDASHKLIADSCIAYLICNNTLAKRLETFPLLDYAWNQWVWHAVYDIDPATRSKHAQALFQYVTYPEAKLLLHPEIEAVLKTLHWVGHLPRSTESNDKAVLNALQIPYFYEEFEDQGLGGRAASQSQPLAYPQSIRLVTILPSEDDGPEFRCRLFHSSLSENEGYDAVSYSWGSRLDDAFIRINGQPQRITNNLGNILRVLRRTRNLTGRAVWIDALCINMSDVAEKSAQANLVARIYKEAQEVAVVLENHDTHPTLALPILECVSALLLGNSDTHQPIEQQLRKYLHQSSSSEIWAQIQSLFSQQWWGRMWPIQEIVSATRATIVYGRPSIDFDHMQRVMANELKSREILKKIYQELGEHNTAMFFTGYLWDRARAIGDLRSVMQKTSRLELPHLLYATRYRNVGDDRDRIYSVLPLSMIGIAAPDGPAVDYSRQADQAFTDCSRYILGHYGNLDILSYVTNMRHDFHPSKAIIQSSVVFRLPSWASTFAEKRLVTRPFVKGLFQISKYREMFAACGNMTVTHMIFRPEDMTIIARRKIFYESNDSKYRLLLRVRTVPRTRYRSPDDFPKLLVKGVVVDRVRQVSLHAGKMWTHRAIEERKRVFKLLEGIQLKKGQNETDIEVIWKTMVADQWTIGLRGFSISQHPPLPRTEDEESRLKERSDDSGLAFADNRRIFVSENGYIGIGPGDTQPEDYIIVLPGARVPYIFSGVEYDEVSEHLDSGEAWRDYADWVNPKKYGQRTGRNSILTSTSDEEKFWLVGESYVHGIMDGEIMEAVQRGELQMQDITIV